MKEHVKISLVKYDRFKEFQEENKKIIHGLDSFRIKGYWINEHQQQMFRYYYTKDKIVKKLQHEYSRLENELDRVAKERNKAIIEVQNLKWKYEEDEPNKKWWEIWK